MDDTCPANDDKYSQVKPKYELLKKFAKLSTPLVLSFLMMNLQE